MLSLLELAGSVRPKNERGPSVAVPTLPLQLGVKLFQSVHPFLVTARSASASSNPVWSAIDPEAPQPVAARSLAVPVEVLPRAGKSEKLALEEEWRAAGEEEREAKEACPWARERSWVELTACRTAEPSPGRCCATWRPEAA